MQIVQPSSNQEIQNRKQAVAIAATFTAEPIEDTLNFWIKELGLPFAIEFAPYNQVFQQLLDPGSLLSQNRGVNVILLRFEDWRRTASAAEEQADSVITVERNLQDLITALKSAVVRSSTPHLVCLCPASPNLRADPVWQSLCQRLEETLVAELSGIGGLVLIRAQDFATYPVEDYYDLQRDQLGHIPYTSLFFTAIGTVLARKIYTIKNAPHKVIVLDCDNTIWKGIVGEDGVMGIEIPPDWQSLQEFMVTQQKAGMILCLCSKNNEPDVLEVFEQRQDMPMKLEYLVSWRINWLPKSENLKSLAQELNLGLDSFIFIDDNPVECAEVQANCPEVLALQLPIDSNIPQFLQHVWAFDHLKVTEEDKQRTALYKQNVERGRFQQEAPSIEDFLAGLDIKIQISEPTSAQLPRVAQLTQRTNQFNFTTVRRSDSEIQQLSQAGLECRIVEVSDRFGDYGLVGVMIFGTSSNTLNVDTFLLSCRVLGRGVEHRMLNYLGDIAKQRSLSVVNALYSPTKKSLPALNFLERVGAEFQQPTETGTCFSLPTDVAATISYAPTSSSVPTSESEKPKQPEPSSNSINSPANKSKYLSHIASELCDPQQILYLIESQRQATRPQLEQPFVAPRTEVEKQLVSLWTELLHLEQVGIQDNYFDLGGTSLLSVELFAQIEKLFGKKLPLTTLIEAPTIEQLANRINRSATGDSLVLIKEGGSKTPVFLIHDGDGETMLYRNLANRLKPDHAVYGLQPYSQTAYPILHTRIPQMAAFYREKIQAVQPEGPYLLGGMCAGGVIAFEVARQLQTQGQVVGLVALIDAADVEARKQVGRVANIRLQRFSSALNNSQSSKPRNRLFYILRTIGRKATNLIVYEAKIRLKKMWLKLQLFLFRYWLDRGLTLPKFLSGISVRTIYERAEKSYRPQGLYEGEVTLFRATQGEESDEPYIEVYEDPLLGWGKRVTKGVRVYDIPGGHSSMLQEPNVEVMADKIQAYIDEVLTYHQISTNQTSTTI